MNTIIFRGDYRWSFDKNTGRQHFGPHGGKPNTPSHWHKDTPRISLPAGDFNAPFAIGGGVVGGAAGATIGSCGCL